MPLSKFYLCMWSIVDCWKKMKLFLILEVLIKREKVREMEEKILHSWAFGTRLRYHWWSVCTNAHFQVYNERAFNEFFATLRGVTLILSLPHQYVCVCVLLNIILTPHLVGLVTMRLARLVEISFFGCCCDSFSYKSVHRHFRQCKIDFFFTAIA